MVPYSVVGYNFKSTDFSGNAVILFSEWHDGVLTVLLRRQAQQLLLHDTDKNTTGKPLMKWLHLDGTVISSSFPFFFGLEYFSKPVAFRSTNQETTLANHNRQQRQSPKRIKTQNSYIQVTKSGGKLLPSLAQSVTPDFLRQ